MLVDQDDNGRILRGMCKRDSNGLFTVKIMNAQKVKNNGPRTGVYTESNKGINKEITDLASLWLKNMGHMNKQVIKKDRIAEVCMALNDKLSQQTCKTCVDTKQSKMPARRKLIGKSENTKIHTDIYRPLSRTTFGGKKYFVTFTTAP